MALRTREIGDQSQFAITSTDGNLMEARYNFTTHEYELRSTPMSSSIAGGRDTRSTISDNVGCRSRYNGCSHTRYRHGFINGSLGSHSAGLIEQGSWFTYGRDLGNVAGSIFPSSLDFFDTYSAPLPTINWGSLVSDVGSATSGRMSASTSMLASAAEMSQTIGMIKNPFSLLRRDWRRVCRDATPSRLAKDGANIWLEGRYGWRPFLSDIRAVAQSQNKVRQHMQYLQQIEGSWQSLASRQEDTIRPNIAFLSFGNSASGGAWILEGVTRKAHFSCDYYMSHVARRYSSLDLHVQNLGLSNVPEALWDLVPFSFTVDWFIDIGDLVSRNLVWFDARKFRQLGYSVKTEYSLMLKLHNEISIRGDTKNVELSSPPFTAITQYVRSAGFPPETATVGFLGGLSLTHMADGLALVAQRLP